jgi:hypothetical protein
VAGFLLYRELRTRPSRVAESISRKDAADAKGSIAKKAVASIAFLRLCVKPVQTVEDTGKGFPVSSVVR